MRSGFHVQSRRGTVSLWCARGHEHIMSPEQADRLWDEPCWQCGAELCRRTEAETWADSKSMQWTVNR